MSKQSIKFYMNRSVEDNEATLDFLRAECEALSDAVQHHVKEIELIEEVIKKQKHVLSLEEYFGG